MQTISIDIGIGTLTYNEKEVSEIREENILMKDAILMVLNPAEVEKSDTYFQSERQAKDYLRTVYLGNWNQDFIDKIFKLGSYENNS